MEASTKTRNLDAIQREGLAESQIDRIRVFLDSNFPEEYTRQELSIYVGLTINATCGRVDELLKQQLAVESIQRKCTITGRTVKTVRANRGYWQESMILDGK
jgi:hypothetical protein